MYAGILVLDGIELNFFIVAHILLCFGFVTKGVLIIHQCFSYCWTVLKYHQDLLSLTLLQQQVDWGCTNSWEGTQRRQLIQTYQRDIPYHMPSRLAIKNTGKKGGWFRVTVFVFPRNHYMWWSPAFLEMAKHLPANGKELINSLFCFACIGRFWFPYYLNPQVFALLPSLFSPPSAIPSP